MIRTYPEQLSAQLNEGLRTCYLFTGNEPFLLQECQAAVRLAARPQGFAEHFTSEIDANTDWQSIFATCQSLSLFASRQIMTLSFSENGPNAAMAEQLTTLSTLLHSDILLMLCLPKLSKAQENSAWFKTLSLNAVQVPCQTPEKAQLPRWISARAKSMKLSLDDAAIQLLCYCYEGNLLALAQALERLSLLWPDGKLTLPRVEQAVNDAAHFSPFHWVDALLAGKSKRSQHILRQLRSEDCEPIILMRTLQRELMLLLTLQRQMNNAPLRTLFDQHRVWQNRRPLFSEALQRLSAKQVTQSIHLLAQTEISLKKDYGQNIWPELETLTLLLCSSLVTAGFNHA
ncbi:DNA polymerase III subunit delta [Erwinia tracheiphila]|uniref:DNA polymerase III subunit delta n=1 Tax=Erwinia tracheiphila TaxID=65700 RepID=A0A0M2KLA4_9GAMM|nr:DNA polymerase III subunit delta [Erwinia tracheiphila]EOS93977.1 DNA polymerase III subunit delta [Erwinia tracheiphila PSU-1]KKF38097.1 DNA polymerase III subunit delta [Erwinia tracheiphila]UIA89489.1 DNA polymerase III subunit delta [Erwinia tracheiphila]UIA97871.1 DNA polymerase III subunit delta [Erwinia tracheiphila]